MNETRCQMPMDDVSPALWETAGLFEAGNYTLVALRGASEEWQTHAALGLVGKTREALEGLTQENKDLKDQIETLKNQSPVVSGGSGIILKDRDDSRV